VAVPPDSIRATLHRVFAARAYSWDDHFDPLAWLREHFLRLSDWLDKLRVAHPLAYLVLLLVLVGLFALIVVHLSWLVRRAMRAAVARAGLGAPVLPTRDALWHLAEARRLGNEGRYREALAERFVALALRLDQRGLVRFHPSKTPGEYAHEARLTDADRGELSALVRDLYRYLFGGVPVSPETWGAFDAAAGRVEGGSAPA
jgi:hypothetical protein